MRQISVSAFFPAMILRLTIRSRLASDPMDILLLWWVVMHPCKLYGTPSRWAMESMPCTGTIQAWDRFRSFWETWRLPTLHLEPNLQEIPAFTSLEALGNFWWLCYRHLVYCRTCWVDLVVFVAGDVEVNTDQGVMQQLEVSAKWWFSTHIPQNISWHWLSCPVNSLSMVPQKEMKVEYFELRASIPAIFHYLLANSTRILSCLHDSDRK